MRLFLGFAACAVVALALGMFLGGHPGDMPSSLRKVFVDDDRATQAELIDTIEDNYYKPVTASQLKTASLKGIVSSLHDPFSHSLTPQERKEFEESVSGSFEGVGMTVEQDKRGL